MEPTRRAVACSGGALLRRAHDGHHCHDTCAEEQAGTARGPDRLRPLERSTPLGWGGSTTGLRSGGAHGKAGESLRQELRDLDPSALPQPLPLGRRLHPLMRRRAGEDLEQHEGEREGVRCLSRRGSPRDLRGRVPEHGGSRGGGGGREQRHRPITVQLEDRGAQGAVHSAARVVSLDGATQPQAEPLDVSPDGITTTPSGGPLGEKVRERPRDREVTILCAACVHPQRLGA